MGSGKRTPHPRGIARQNDRAMQERGCRGGSRAPARGGRTARAPRRPARWAPPRLWPDATRDGRGRRCGRSPPPGPEGAPGDPPVAVRYTAERTSGWRKVTRWPRARSPSVSVSTAETAMPSRPAARRAAADRRLARPPQAVEEAALVGEARIVAGSSPGSVPSLLAPLAARSLPPAASPSIRVATRATPTDFRASPR